MSSFNRKFRRNQQKKTMKFTEMNDMLDMQIAPCKTCSEIRTRLSFNELPDNVKPKFVSSNDGIEYYLYCSNCNYYSPIISGGSF